MNPIRFLVATGLLLLGLGVPLAQARSIEHVILISVDGLHPDAVTTLIDQGLAPNFLRLRTEGSFTDNARTDPEVAYTLPNHASMFTGHHVFGNDGHGWTLNEDPGKPITLHLSKSLQKGRRVYIASVFDIVHDHGLSTALYANNGDFRIFNRSWNKTNGARDRTGPDNGRDKIDTFFSDDDMTTVANAFVSDMAQSHYHFAFLHLREPDSTGHAKGWLSSEYLEAVRAVDAVLGMIFGLVDTDPELSGKTALILTADHSGEPGTTFHLLLPPYLIESGIVPFYVWGPGVATNAEFYTLNPASRLDPERTIPSTSEFPPPIRNGDAANLVLDLFGRPDSDLNLPSVRGSVINREQNLFTQCNFIAEGCL
jgi:hypothetical protein